MPVQRVPVDAFLDPSNTASSLQASPSRAVNEYLESVAPGHGKSPIWSKRTPGIHKFTDFGDGPMRGFLNINGRVFGVGGATFGEVDADGNISNKHPVANDGRPAAMCSSGSASNQVLITSGGLGYVFDLGSAAFTQIIAPAFPFPARICEFMNGYFFVLKGAGSRSFFFSKLEDALTWPGLNVLERSFASDNVLTIVRSHEELVVIGGATSEVWRDVGQGNTIFEPVPGVLIEHGGIGIFAAKRCDNSIIWLGANEDGYGIVWRMDGYTPRRISTFAVETALQSASFLSNASAFVYQVQGHVFYVLIVPQLPTAWVYDVTMDRWHEEGVWDVVGARYYPPVYDVHVSAFGKQLVGDRRNGTIYELSQEFFDQEIVGSVAA